MRIISVINYKGGTAKTTTALHLAMGLSLAGFKVLAIDADPQGSMTQFFGLDDGKKGLYDVLVGLTSFAQCKVAISRNLHAICANERLYPAELKMMLMPKKELLLRSKMASCGGYDYVLIDCAPSMNLLNQNALLASHELIVPVSMEYMALSGVKQLLNNLKIVNKIFDKNVVLSKVVPTFYNARQKKSATVLESLTRVFPSGRISSPIRSSLVVSEALVRRKTVFEYAPDASVTKDYQNLVSEVIKDGQKKAI